MPIRTQLFSQFPWSGGVNLAVDPGLIEPGELTQADNIVMDTRGSRKKRPGFNFDFDSGFAQITKITTVADVDDNLDGLTFIIQDASGSVAFWMDVDNSGTTIPAAASAADRAVEITTITTNMTATQVADAVSTAVNNDASFTANSENNQVYIWLTSPLAFPVSAASTSTFTVTSYFTEDSAILNIRDFWYFDNSDNTKKQLIVTVDDEKTLAVTTPAGVKTFIPDGGTLWPNPITEVSFTAFNNKLIIAVDGATNKIKRYDPETEELSDLEGSPVDASIVREHLGRLWYNNKTDPDRIYYTTTFDHTEHNGNGDSGAMDIAFNDGDPKGITAIFPTFKGELFVSKRTKMYRITGYFPETFQIIPVSAGIGCISHNSVVAIDQDDVFFASERGIHSLAATNQFGDFNSTFVSANIQPLFRTNFVDRDKITAAYIPSLNSYAFTVTDDTRSSTIKSTWLYNIILKVWYRWYTSQTLNLSLNCIASVLVDDTLIPYFGANNGRIAKNRTDNLSDISPAGALTAIELVVKTGFIFTDGNPYIVKAFKRLGIVYSPSPNSGLEFDFQVDNFIIQNFFIVGNSAGSTLGIGSPDPFVLGESILAGNFTLAPNTVSVEGYGRGFQLTIRQSAINQDVEVQGFQIEWEGAGTRQQTPVTSDGDLT